MNGVIQAEIVDEYQNDNMTDYNTNDYTNASEYTEKLVKTNEDILRENKIPERKIANDISTTEMSIDIAMAALAKQTSHKLLKLEGFLGKIEDILFNDTTIAEMSKGDLMDLYTATRMMKADSFRTLNQIKKDIDFEKLEMDIIASNIKGDNQSSAKNVNEVIDKIVNSNSFLDQAIQSQLDEIDNG